MAERSRPSLPGGFSLEEMGAWSTRLSAEDEKKVKEAGDAAAAVED